MQPKAIVISERNLFEPKPMLAAIAICCASLAPALAQVPASPAIATSGSNENVVENLSVPSGTQITIEITDLVSTRTAKRDDFFNIRLAAPVILNGVIVIPEGTLGKGQVVDAGLPGMGGKPGKLVLAARYLELDGQRIPLRGLTMDMSARDNGGPAVLLSSAGGAAGAVIGLIVTGGHMEVQAGTRANAKLGAAFSPTAATAPNLPPTSN